MHQTPFDYIAKAILIGAPGVGKTSTHLRYCDNTFTLNHVCTIGIDYKIKTTVIEGKKLKLQIWDTAGAERYRNISRIYYRGTTAIVIMFDITDAESFKNIDNWLLEIGQFADPNVCKILLGNKLDLLQSRAVSYEEAYTKARHNEMQYYEISAKTGENVVQAFESLWSVVLHSPILLNPKKEETKNELYKIQAAHGFFDKCKQYCN